MSTPLLFTPITLGGLTIANRAWVAPMCQYSATDGVVNDWHLVHYGAFAQGGFGLVLTEATAVTPIGRISPADAGLWSDEHIAPWRRVTDFVHTQRIVVDDVDVPTRIGVQLAHAGRKASVHAPFAPGSGSVPLDAGGWVTVAPSAVAFEGYSVPYAAPVSLDDDGIAHVISDFANAAQRARFAGFDVVEIHAAHGYLLHQFLSPLSNRRTDRWGGDFAGRTRLALAVTEAVRAVWDGPLFVRISATDWTPGGWDVEQSAELAGLLQERGVDLIDVSSGGNVIAKMPLGPGYQVPLAEQIKRASGAACGAVGLITEPEYAEGILREDEADAILLARGALREPHWPQRAAAELGYAGIKGLFQPQHERGVLG